MLADNDNMSMTSQLTLPSHLTSIQFGDRMADGWKAGLSELHAGSQIRLNWKVRDRVSGKDVGDIDSAVTFNENKFVASIFPSTTIFASTSARISSIKSCNFFVEFKRSCSNSAMPTHINQFVKFYGRLLDPANRGNINMKNWPRFLKNAMDSTDLVILFVFNGADNTEFERSLRRELGGILEIHGRLVVTAWCPSEDIIKWKDMQEKARSEANEARLQAENKRLRQELQNSQRANKKQRTKETNRRT